MDSLSVKLEHTLRVYALPAYHKDPFDRILVAQALSEKLPIVTADPQIARYPVEVMRRGDVRSVVNPQDGYEPRNVSTPR